jgi:hypothetical protein
LKFSAPTGTLNASRRPDNVIWLTLKAKWAFRGRERLDYSKGLGLCPDHPAFVINYVSVLDLS